VLTALSGTVDSRILRVQAEKLSGGSGAATSEVVRLVGDVEGSEGQVEAFRVVSKTVGRLEGGRHAAHTNEPDHWAYWRRELIAYASGLLPAGPGLRAPRCYGVVNSTIFMEDVAGGPEDPHLAAARLGAWQATNEVCPRDWLVTNQLAQRVTESDLDWSVVDADRRAAILRAARTHLLEHLQRLPPVLSHGDCNAGNLLQDGDDTVLLDWGTVGTAPLGADLAYLTLSTLTDLTTEYLSGLDGRRCHSALLGYRITLALVGSSRLHWMLSRGHAVPRDYMDLIWDARPPL
jgi:hypothetical protein